MPQYAIDSDQLAMLAESSGRTLDSVLDHFGLGSGNQTVQPSQGPQQPVITGPTTQTPPSTQTPPVAQTPPSAPPPTGLSPEQLAALNPAQRRQLEGLNLSAGQLALRLRRWGIPLTAEQQAGVAVIDQNRGNAPGGGPSAQSPPRPMTDAERQAQPPPDVSDLPSGSHIPPGAVLGPNQVRVGDRVFTRGLSGSGNPLSGFAPEAQVLGGLTGGGGGGGGLGSGGFSGALGGGALPTLAAPGVQPTPPTAPPPRKPTRGPSAQTPPIAGPRSPTAGNAPRPLPPAPGQAPSSASRGPVAHTPPIAGNAPRSTPPAPGQAPGTVTRGPITQTPPIAPPSQVPGTVTAPTAGNAPLTRPRLPFPIPVVQSPGPVIDRYQPPVYR